jgi:protein SCO1/2
MAPFSLLKTIKRLKKSSNFRNFRSLAPALLATAPLNLFLICGAILADEQAGAAPPPSPRPPDSGTNWRCFQATGVIKEVPRGGKVVTIQHEAIPNYMPAMAMPFNVRDSAELDGLRPGDEVSFRLVVTDDESWIDRLARSKHPKAEEANRAVVSETLPQNARPRHPLMDFPFTNEIGAPVRLADFRGQAVAITFFFTRCPIPEYCPRLSRNFEEASRKLAEQANSLTNWHFLSVSFDPAFDTPEVLRAYAERYHYDPKHWTFLTGPADKIEELADQSNVSAKREGGVFNHNFRTLIIDAGGHLQTVFPTSGDLSDAIVSEMLKGAAVTNRPS